MQLLTVIIALVFSPCTTNEAKALRDLYTKTFDKHKNSAGNYDRGWKRYRDWMSGDPCGDGTANGRWEGVTCVGCPACRITELSLYNNGLRGSYTSSMFSPLTELRVLHLRANSVTGTFPSGVLPLMTKLTHLHLGDSLTGTLPDWTNSKKTLQVIHMSGPFSGNLKPNYLDLPQATDVRFWATKLTGPLPPFNLMPKVTKIYIASNRVLDDAPIPDLGSNPELKSLTLYHSRLNGNIPSFSNLGKLDSLDLRYNALTGDLPEFPSYSILKTVRVHNNLISSLSMHRPPQDKLKFPLLTLLEAHTNLLTGTLPCHSDVYPSLATLEIGYNFMTGTLPCLHYLGGMSIYKVNSNDFTGTLPDSTLPNGVVVFDVTENRLSGTIPSKFLNAMFTAEVVRLGENMFSVSRCIYNTDRSDGYIFIG